MKYSMKYTSSILKVLSLFSISIPALAATILWTICMDTQLGFASSSPSPSQFRNVRELAMGRATTAIVDNESSLYVNPAGLARAKTWFIKTPGMIVGANSAFLDNRDDLMDLQDDSKSESERIRLIKAITPLKTEMIVGVNPLFSFTAPGFGIGAFAQGDVRVDVVNRVSPRFSVDGVFDVSPMVGGATTVTVYGKDVTLGVSARYIHREKLDGVIEIGDLIQALDDNDSIPSLNHATLHGVNIDLGLLTEFDTRFFGEFDFGFTIKNLGPKLKGTSKFGEGDSHTVEEAVPIESVIGIAKELNLLDGSRWRYLAGRTLLTADYRLISQDSGVLKNLHFGIEQQILFNRVALRGGINQGYIVGGFGIDLFYFHFDYALYVYEKGAEVSHEDETLHVVQAGFVF